MTRAKRLTRFNAFGISKNHSMVFDLNPDSSWIMINPRVEGRIVNLSKTLEENNVPNLDINFRDVLHEKAKDM